MSALGSKDAPERDSQPQSATGTPSLDQSPAISQKELPSSPQTDSGSSSPERRSDDSTAQDLVGGIPMQHVSIAISVLLGLLTLRAGIFNLFLVILTAAALVLNPYVRTFLDLPTRISNEDQDSLGPLDPARYFTAFSHKKGDKSSPGTPEKDNQDAKSTGQSTATPQDRLQMIPLPDHIQRSVDQLAPLIIKDFVEGWYTHHSFGYPNFPHAARGTIDHMIMSIWSKAIQSRLQSVDVATELVLTGSSVFLTCIRRKRFANLAAASGDRMAAKAAMRGGTGHWNSNEERQASLRMAMRAFFKRHLPPSESESVLVFPLVTEILTKQLWNLLLTVGEPDFLNRNLVGWKEKQMAASAAAPQPQNRAQTPAAASTDRQANGTTISRPASRAAERLQQADASAHAAQSDSHNSQEQSPPLSRPSETAPPPLPERPPSVPPRLSMSSGAPISIPDRGMISTPPSRTDSPMMPSFASAQARASIVGTGRVMSPGRASLDNALQRPASPGSPLNVSPSPYVARTGQPQPLGGPSPTMTSSYASQRMPSRTSSELSEGLSAVVGGLGNVVKGVGKGADAVVGSVGDVLTGSHPDATPERLKPSSQSQSQRLASPITSGVASEAWRRSPSSVDRASADPKVLQNQHNVVRRKQAPKKGNDLTEMMASHAAWPSNLPAGFAKSAEGESLPPSLAQGLRRQPSGAQGDAGRSESPLKRRSVQANSPPRMNSSLPYEISPRQSLDGGGYYREMNDKSGMGHYTISSPGPQNVISSQPSGHPSVPSRPSSSLRNTPSLPPRPHPGMSSLPSAPALSSVLSRNDSEGLYDAFEAFLEGSSPSLTAQSIPSEGEELLRLQIGLGTIERLVPRSAGEEAEMFREDASTILAKVRDGLQRALQEFASRRDSNDSDNVRSRPATALVKKLDDAVIHLGFGPQGFTAKEGTVRDALEPVQVELTNRLQQLYALFWKHRCEGKKNQQQQQQPPPQRMQSPAPPSMHSGLSYQPRSTTKHAASVGGSSVASRDADQSRNQHSGSPIPAAPASSKTIDTQPAPASVRRASLQAPKPRQAILDHFINLNDDDEDEDEAESQDAFRPPPAPQTDSFDSLMGRGPGFQERGALNVAVTDISANADRSDAPVDARSFEFICAVEGGFSAGDAEGGGFVLVRSWSDIVTLHKGLQKVPNMASSQVPALPATKGRTSAMLCTELETFLVSVLGSTELSQTGPVLQFADRTRAGTSAAAAAAKTGFNPFSSGVELGRALGKNLVDGVGAVGKAAATGLQVVPNQVGATTSAGRHQRVPSSDGDLISGDKSVSSVPPTTTDGAVSGLIDTAERTANANNNNNMSQSSTSQTKPSSQGLSSRALDAILTSIFALADEALSLTGAWSMRRGVVRLLQSVVRQSYSSSIISAFDGVSSSLTSSNVSSTMDFIRETFWSSQGKFTHVKGPARSAKERIESEEKAREIVKGYAPTQAAFVLGPGGKQACEKGLEAVHGVICDDDGALDLALTMTLRLLQML
ncbi:unnamed protein product [Sympodiomycopsis kandeliae]